MGNELKIRRVVTGHDARGRAVVLKDGVVQGARFWAARRVSR
jgi:hypothetical protein